MMYDFVFHGSFFLLLMVLAYGWVWKPFRLERFKMSLAKGRDELFDYWHNQGLSTENYAYKMLLQVYDRAYDKAHLMTTWNLVLIILHEDFEDFDVRKFKLWFHDLTESIHDLPVEAQAIVCSSLFRLGQLSMQRFKAATMVLELMLILFGSKDLKKQNRLKSLNDPLLFGDPRLAVGFFTISN